MAKNMTVPVCLNLDHGQTFEDCKMCIDAGADIIGILVGQEHTSDDFVDKENAKKIQYIREHKDIILPLINTSKEHVEGKIHGQIQPREAGMSAYTTDLPGTLLG